MKIQILSDLHNEFYQHSIPDISSCGADIIILAGDIDTGENGLCWAREQELRLDTPILYVPGNHEYYGHEYNQIFQTKRFEYIKDDVRFICATMWTDYMSYGGKGGEWFNKRRAISFMPDFDKILIDGAKPHPNDFQLINHIDVQFIKDRLDVPFDGKTVVVTHHGPSVECQHRLIGHNAVGSFFYNDFDYFFDYDDYGIDMWVFGHTHYNIDIVINRTRLVSNQRGYQRESTNRTFDPNKIVDLI